MIPDLSPPIRCIELIQWFFNIRSFMSDVQDAITMADIEGWQRHRTITLERWERECMFTMDRAFRSSYANVVRYHSQRTQVKDS